MKPPVFNESCADTYLRVYEVVKTGIDEMQVRNLAEALKIPVNKVSLQHGMASFVDPASYIAVPTVPVADTEIGAAQRQATKNHHPEIPIEVKAIDYAALGKLSALGREEVLRSISAALESAGLMPEGATPIVGHTVFKTVSTTTNKRVPDSTKTNLDTHVRYRFTLDGYLLIGPGAQVQVSYGPDGNVTRMIHSTRTLKRASEVKIIPAEAVRCRFARFLPEDAEVKLRLVYWAPPFGRESTRRDDGILARSSPGMPSPSRDVSSILGSRSLRRRLRGCIWFQQPTISGISPR